MPRPRPRRLLPVLVTALLAVCGLAGGGVWLVTRCDRAAYTQRAAWSWLNEQEKYLFACGQVWHTFNNGRTWAAITARGLPLLVRDGYIAVDREPGRLYLGLVLGGHSRPTCLLCAWTQATPALYLSTDGGQHWIVAQRFTPGPAGSSYFRAVYADPDYAGSAWAILVRGDETAYYATNTRGNVWRKTCIETYSGQCDPPDAFLADDTLLDRLNDGRYSDPP
ncbi:MAG: hypothetical protein IT317_09060 [Anaerolineales bacterium]|nr:hypothetical protein [Anaerolineales bacterium]